MPALSPLWLPHSKAHLREKLHSDLISPHLRRGSQTCSLGPGWPVAVVPGVGHGQEEKHRVQTEEQRGAMEPASSAPTEN